MVGYAAARARGRAFVGTFSVAGILIFIGRMPRVAAALTGWQGRLLGWRSSGARCYHRGMLATVASVLGIAVVDSVNPSALLATFALLGRPGYPAKVLIYVAGVFLTYFGIGLVLMLGLDALGAMVGDRLQGDAANAVQGVVGAAMLAWSVFAPGKKGQASKAAVERGRIVPDRPLPLLLFGATVTAVEFTTALPYLGAIGLMKSQGLGIGEWLPLLVVYNAIFVLPPLLVLALYRFLPEPQRGLLDRLKARLHPSREALLWIVGIIGFLLLLDSLAHFDYFGLLGG
jgi:cytochrome c biogenesis protein CcdA